MGTRRRQLRLGVTLRPWIGISVLGLLLLAVPFYDMWDDVSNLSWSLITTLVENSVLILLALGLVYGGIWIGRKEWDPEYKWTVTKWNLGVAAGIALLYAVVIALQLWAMGRLKPWILALDGVLFGAVVAFGVGTYNAIQQITQDELHRSREEYRTLTDDVLDTSDVATFVLDDDFTVVWINQATAEYFDLDREDVLGQDKHELVDEHIADQFENPAEFRDRVTGTYADNSTTEEFECHITGEGAPDERWLQHWSQPIETGLYEGGRIEHYTDITDVKQREQELERRERELRELYDVISDTSKTFEEKVDGVLSIGRRLFDAEYGSFARIDREAGTYEPEVVQTESADVQPGDVIPFSETHCERMIDQGETLQFEARPFDVDEKEYGTDVGFEMYVGTPVYENDSVYGSLCFLDREEALPFDDWQLTMVELIGNWMGYELNRKHLLEDQQQQLRQHEVKFQEFVQSVDNYAIFALDTEGLVTSWNSGAKQIKGYTESEIIGEHFEVFYPDEYIEEDLPSELLTEAAETGLASHQGWRVRKDGTRFWADVTIAPRYDENGEHIGFTKIVQDLTEQRAHERALERKRERLEFLNRIIRHNLLNGLNLINARTDLLESHVDDDPSAREHVEIIQTRVDDMAGLIDTMRTFMDAIITGADHETRPMPVRDELEEKVELARRSYEDAVFRTHDLPDESTRVIADELLGEVFENVLSNAVVHNDEETPTVEVWTSETTREISADGDTTHEISVDEKPDEPLPGQSAEQLARDTAREEREALVVHIADNGPGIPDDEKDAVVEKGVSELSEPGNGFGLYLVKEMMNAYGGSVDIRDNPDGEGTVFDLEFLVEN